MSRNHRYRDRGTDGRLRRVYRHPQRGLNFPRGTPKWWRKLYMTRPRRRHNRALCQLIEKGIDSDTLSFSLGSRKPHVYYW